MTEKEKELLERLKRHFRGIREAVSELEEHLAARDEKTERTKAKQEGLSS